MGERQLALRTEVSAVTAADPVVWSAPDVPYRIEIPAALLEAIRFECSRTSNGIGAVGIGGLLIGSIEMRCLRVIDWRPIPCSHALGPQFRLTPIEEAGLAAQIDGLSLHRDARVCAWFCTHPKGGSVPTDEEAELYARFFASLSVPLLIIEPDAFGALEVSVCTPARHPAWALNRSQTPWRIQPHRLPRRLRTASGAPDLHPTAVPPPAPLAEPELPAPPPPAARSPWYWPAIALVLCLAVSGAVLLFTRYQPSAFAQQAPAAAATTDSAPIEMLSLHASELAGRLAITWNSTSATVRSARRVSLFINEGAATQRRDLSPRQARSGRYYIDRRSPRVHIRLVVTSPDGESFEEETRFVASNRPASPVTPDMLPPAGK